MKLKANGSRVSVPLRKELVAEVKSSLKPGMDFNSVYGQLLSRLEKSEQPSMEQAKLLLQNPDALFADHAARKAASLRAQELLKAQVINANIPKKAANREQLVGDTLAFVARFPTLTSAEVKAVTLLRLQNGNRDPRVVHTHEIPSPDDLAANLENAQHLEESIGKPGVRFSVSSQIFLLQDDESLKSDSKAVAAAVSAMEV